MTPITVLCAVLLVFACTNNEGDGSTNDGADASGNSNIRIIAGNSALGRPGSWSFNCIDTACARANNEGNYRLRTELTANQLISSTIPEPDGVITLYSRYRYDEDVASTLININPSTDAILNAWSWINQGQSIDSCASSSVCMTSLMNRFTPSVENTMVSRLEALMGSAWPAGRNPFSDVYIADATEDTLDLLHDTFQFVVTDTQFQVFDNLGALVTQINVANLISNTSLTDVAVTDDQYEAALAVDPTTSTNENPITISSSISPQQPGVTPVEITVDSSSSRTSSGGILTFEHDLTLANGSTYEFSGETVSTVIDSAGTHVWVVTVNDSNGYSRSQGYAIGVLAAETTVATYGSNGSCVTPENKLTKNTLNICEESRDGSALACDILNTSSVVLIQSPAPCSGNTQNDGQLIGVCTVAEVEMRIFYYENLQRQNNVETIDEKRDRLSAVCDLQFEGDWSESP
ncbi:MAG: hypothetical protein P8X74_09855 [Reinekea sp.]